MSNIEEQMEIEQTMMAMGIERYRALTASAEEQGRAVDTKYGQKLLREFVLPLAEEIEESSAKENASKFKKYAKLIRRLDPEKAAFISLRCLINSFCDNETSVNVVCGSIGSALEDELRFSKFREQNPKYYDTIIKDFKRKGTKSYRHMHRVLTHSANKLESRFIRWTPEERRGVGAKILNSVLDATDLVAVKTVYTGGQQKKLLVPSKDTKEWIAMFNEHSSLLNPDRMPCVVPPDHWKDAFKGGFYSPELRIKTPLVKTRAKEHESMLAGDLKNVTDAINKIQDTPWQVNRKVLSVMEDVWINNLGIGLPKSEPYIVPACPIGSDRDKETLSEAEHEILLSWKQEAKNIYTMEKERISKCFEVMRSLKLARQYQMYRKFWFVYQCDFRGRIYCTVTGLSPQGSDFSKALIKFATGKPLGVRGAYWLKVHIANCYGKDKLPYDERVKWVDDNSEMLEEIANDPLRNKSLWQDSDKPWQFLAACIEYKQFLIEGPEFLSCLPISLDGSCNGLQHFSAMLRDSIGGAAVNLSPAEAPRDIYAEVARVCSLKLQTASDGFLLDWKQYSNGLDTKCLPRSLTKRPVMTLPYGSTRQSCTEYIHKWMLEDAPNSFPKEVRFKMAAALTPTMWDSMGSVVVAARKSMDWLQECAGILSKDNIPIKWWTPDGFPVYQNAKKQTQRRISTELQGTYRLVVLNSTDKSDTVKNKNSIAPNFVHSMDGTHLRMAVQRAVSYGADSFALIHDDFGTHAADTDILHQAIRETFVELYTDNDVLWDFKVYNQKDLKKKLPQPPAKGDLDINQVIDSEYFFG